jgi:DNA-binding NarL/FixJ family response regulator
MRDFKMKSGKKVLIIDNEHKFRHRLQELIKQKHYEVIAVTNKARAQEMLSSKHVDMVVLGTITPKTDMLYLYQWFTQRPSCKEIPLIIINGPEASQFSDERRKQEETGLASVDYFFKPIEPDKILYFIEKQMDRTSKKIKVLVVDDQEIVREGIRIILDLHKDIEVVGEARHGKDAIEKTMKLMPDIVLMDILMPGMNGLEATRQILETRSKAKVLILSQCDSADTIRASRNAGACGFVSKSSVTSQLVSSVRSANRKLKRTKTVK